MKEDLQDMKDKKIDYSVLTEKEIKLLIELEKIRIKKIEVSHKCKLKELEVKREIARLYRSKKHLNKMKKEEKRLNEMEVKK